MLKILKQELAALKQFKEILTREQNALITADIDLITKIAEEKSRHADFLNGISAQRTAAIQQAGFGLDAISFNSWKLSLPPTEADLMATIVEDAKAAQQLNETNGKLINTHLKHNQQAVNVLLRAVGQSEVYGADGQTRISGLTTKTISDKG
jgi:flagella synthesis protein FlgN